MTQRVPEVAQCLKGLPQRVLGLTQVSRRLTQGPEGPTLSFSCAREGFVGQVFCIPNYEYRGIVAVDFSLSTEPVRHPVVLKEILHNNKP